jgi:hypothetical protein
LLLSVALPLLAGSGLVFRPLQGICQVLRIAGSPVCHPQRPVAPFPALPQRLAGVVLARRRLYQLPRLDRIVYIALQLCLQLWSSLASFQMPSVLVDASCTLRLQCACFALAMPFLFALDALSRSSHAWLECLRVHSRCARRSACTKSSASCVHHDFEYRLVPLQVGTVLRIRSCTNPTK